MEFLLLPRETEISVHYSCLWIIIDSLEALRLTAAHVSIVVRSSETVNTYFYKKFCFLTPFCIIFVRRVALATSTIVLYPTIYIKLKMVYWFISNNHTTFISMYCTEKAYGKIPLAAVVSATKDDILK